jgi:hypothetical protein
MRDYFVSKPTFNDQLFRRRFRMRRQLFLRITAAVTEHDADFTLHADAAGRISLSPFHKVTAALLLPLLYSCIIGY